MIRSAIKRLVERGVSIVSSGLTTLRCYPRFAFGRGYAAPPTQINFEITYRCNARCRMCPLHGEHTDNSCQRLTPDDQNKELETGEIKSLLDQCARIGVKDITITGGEPFLRPDLCDVLTHAKAAGIRTSVISNASAIGSSEAAGVVLAGLDSLEISLDGPGEVHDEIRRVPGMFSRVTDAIKLLEAEKARQNTKKPRITLGCTVSALNERHLCEVVRVAAQFDVDISFNPIHYSTPAQESATGRLVHYGEVKPENWQLPDYIIRVNVEQLARQLAAARDLATRLGVKMRSRLGGQGDLIHRFEQPSYSDNNKCFYPWYSVRVTPYGDVYPCSVAVDMGNIRTQTLEVIWNGKRYVEFRRLLRKHRLFPKCAKCYTLNKDDLASRLLP